MEIIKKKKKKPQRNFGSITISQLVQGLLVKLRESVFLTSGRLIRLQWMEPEPRAFEDTLDSIGLKKKKKKRRENMKLGWKQ